MKKSFANSGETLLEVVVAVSVIMIILSPASALYISSNRNLTMDRNVLVASTLAEEGIELVRNIRDTNFLKFESKAQSCWDTVPGAVALGDCDINSNKISDKIKAFTGDASRPAWFSIGIDPIPANLPIVLGPASDKALEAVAPLEQYRLWLDEDPRPANNPRCALGDPTCHKDFRDDTHMYVTVQRGTPTIFYRAVKIQFFDDLKRMMVVSTVVYSSGKGMTSLARSSTFTNQQKVE